MQNFFVGRNTTMRRPNILNWLCLAILLGAIPSSTAQAQELQNNDPNAAPPPGVEKFYWDLSKSRDGATRSLADRYLNTTKTQEWSDLSGKFKTFARYVKHDPGLATVTIEISKGRGADKTTDQKTIPVDKLSKSCQSRVRQIDAMQKKLKEMAQTAAASNGGAITIPGTTTPEGPGADPSTTTPGATGPDTSAPTAEAPDPSENEPDPLGFAELPPVTLPPSGLAPPAVPAGAGPGAPPGVNPEAPPPSVPTAPAGASSSFNSPELLKTAFVAALEAGDKAALKKMLHWGNANEAGRKMTMSMLLDEAGKYKIRKMELQQGEDGVSQPDSLTMPVNQAFRIELASDSIEQEFVWPVGEVAGSYYLAV
jgi:hypothetical protein